MNLSSNYPPPDQATKWCGDEENIGGYFMPSHIIFQNSSNARLANEEGAGNK